jgi:choline dehydrogenase-like flavoprotein
MLNDLLQADSETVLTTEICVIGAGAAGVALARDLENAGHEVCLLEGGGMDYENDTQALCKGRNIGAEYYELDHSRLRFFGGTTNIWGGRCVPLDAIDFERRDWVPHSGWPISRADLEPWYQIAHDSLELGEYEYSAALWCKLALEPIDFDPEEIATTFWRFDAMKERFNRDQNDDLIASARVNIFLHANLVALRCDEHAHHITTAEARSLQGHLLKVRARHYVLACGAIENARLLLLSNDVVPAGIGNAHGHVGRYFMEHPHARIAHIATKDPAGFWALYRKRYARHAPPVAPALVASEGLQRRAGMLNSAASFKPQRDPSRGLALGKKVYMNLKHSLNPSRSGRMIWHGYRGITDFLQAHVSMPLLRLAVKAARMQLYVIARAEQAPNPESRVILSEQRDELGCRRADLDWRLSALDKHSVRELAASLGREFDRLQLGRVTAMDWLHDDSSTWPVDPTIGNHPIGGYHHMGTTRMSATPAHGVVDANCTVHGMANLHIAGSSVFTTGGWANPTLTLLALAHRLAHHIDGLLKKGS